MYYSANLKKKLLISFVVFILIVLLDQLTKRFMINDIGLNNSKPFIPGIMEFMVVQNTGGAFSIFKEYPIYFQIIGLVNVLIFSYLAFCPTKAFNTITKLGCVCILGGTVGNLIDRFLLSGVIDFLDLQLFNFAVFNLADVFIDIGVVLIIIGWILSGKKNIQCHSEPKAKNLLTL